MYLSSFIPFSENRHVHVPPLFQSRTKLLQPPAINLAAASQARANAI